MMTTRIFPLFFLLSIIGCATGTPPISPAGGETSSAGGEDLTEPLPEAPTVVLDEVEAPVIERNTSPTAHSYRLVLGATAPMDGLLLNDEAAAFLIAEMEAYEARVLAALEAQRDMDLARLHLEVERLRLMINTDRERFGIILTGRDREITRLLEMNQRFVDDANAFPWDTVLIGVGGLVLGLLGGFIFGVVAGL